MARKKSTQRRVKMDGNSNHSPGIVSGEHNNESPVYDPMQEMTDQQATSEDLSDRLSKYGRASAASPAVCPDGELSQEKAIVSNIAVEVKEEPITDFKSHSCPKTSHSEATGRALPIRVKKERLSVDAKSDCYSFTRVPGTAAEMDLGSHLERSLNDPLRSGLTWSQLMEAKNYPRVHDTGAVQTDRVVKGEKSRSQQRVPFSTNSIPLESPPHPQLLRISPRPGQEDMIVLSDSSKSSNSPPVTGPPTTGTSTTSSRFYPNSGNGGKLRLKDGSAVSNLLDLSKNSIPLEIRRVLTSKYGLPKRNDESHLGAMVPNFNKSRSRFTVGAKKTPGVSAETESNDKIEIPISPPFIAFEQEKDLNEGKAVGQARSLPSVVLSRSTEPSHTAPRSKPPVLVSSELGENLSVPENRESNRSPLSLLTPSDHRASHSMNQERRMIDLSNTQHYRPSSQPSQTYRPRPTAARNARRSASPGLGPRPLPPKRPPSAEYQTPVSMIDLGSFGKGLEFQGVASRRAIPQHNRVAAVGMGRIPKRRHSLDSQSIMSDRGKRICTERSKPLSERPEMKTAESAVKLNIGDLLQLEQEEQRYIKDLSHVQGQLTDVRFKIQQMQQELEILQCQEIDIKRLIDKVRTKRVTILKDAQDHEGSEGTRGTRVPGVSDKNEDRVGLVVRERQDVSESRVTPDRGSPGFLTTYRTELSEGSTRNTETKRKVEIVAGVEDEDRHLRGQLDRPSIRRVELSSESSDDKSDSHYGNRLPANRQNVPSEIVLYSSRASSNRGGSEHRDFTHSRRNHPVTSSNGNGGGGGGVGGVGGGNNYGKENLGKFASLDSNGAQRAFQEKISWSSEKPGIGDNCSVAENGDGTLLVRRYRHPATLHARKGSNSVILEESDLDYEGEKGLDCGVLLTDGSEQFLGCLEISSTTEEPLTEEDEGPIEVLAEKERESFADKLRCDQERISSTVPSLDFKQVDTAVASSSCEIEFVGHTRAVCFVLVCLRSAKRLYLSGYRLSLFEPPSIMPYKGKLYSASADRTAKAFDLKTGECTTTFQGHHLAVNCLQIAYDGANRDRLFTGSNDQTVRAYNAKSGACTHKFSFRGRVMCLHIAFGKLFVGLSSGFVAVIDLKSNTCVDQFNCHEPRRISCITSASEGQRSLLCTGSFDSTITIRDQCSGLLLRTIKDHKLTVLCMQVVENILFSGSADTVVQSHNINTGELVRSYTSHTMSVSGLQALGGVLVTSSLDRIIRCFDIETGDLLQLYGGNTDMIFSLSVFSDMIYTGCKDGRLSGVKLDLRKYHCCKWSNCSLKFGLLTHLKQHVQDHVNQTIGFDSCCWEGCFHKFPRGKQIDVIQAAMEHIISHVPDMGK